MPVSANTVTIVNPINNMDLRAGYTQSILVQAGAGITSVDFFVNGVNVGQATAPDMNLNTVLVGDALVTGFYRFDHTFATAGEFEIRAVGNNGADSTVTVTVRNATPRVFANETFEDFFVTEIEASESVAMLRPPPNALVTWPTPATALRPTHSPTFSGIDIGGRPGRSLGVVQNDPVLDVNNNVVIPGQGFGDVMFHLANPINGGRVVYEISVFPVHPYRSHLLLNFGNPNSAAQRWSGLWMGGAGALASRVFGWFNGANPGNMGVNTFLPPPTFNANEWHDFRIEIDLDNFLVDMHMRVNSEDPNDFEKIVSQARIGPNFETILSANIAGNTLTGGALRFTGVNNAGTQRAYFDNLRITQYLLDPHITGVRFQPVTGPLVTDSENAPRELASIQVQMSTAFNGMIPEDAFELFMVVDGVRLPIPVTGSYNTQTRIFTMVPEFPLRYFRDYEIVFAGAASLQGVAPLAPATLEFRTQRGSVNLDNVVFTPATLGGAANVNATATVSNNSGSAATVMLITAAYEGEELIGMVVNTVPIPAGATQNVPLAITGISGATTVRVHMVTSLVSFRNLPVSFTLE